MGRRLRPERRLLVIGGSGELGSQVVAAAAGWDVYATYLTRRPKNADATWFMLDVTQRQIVREAVFHLRPDVIVHAAVSDRSTDDLQAGVVDGGRYVAQAAAEVNARCIAISTDLVFDGKKGNYNEADPPHPIMAYGQAKADMERALLAMETDLALVRTSLILTLQPMGKHVAWIVDALRRGEPRNLFTDELRCPIWSDELAAALLELATLDYRGLLHIAGPEVTHRYALGMALADYFDLDPSPLSLALSAESGLNRPLDCTLDCARAYQLLETPIRGVSSRLEDLSQYLSPLPV
jgi:dTDP-4-dehydrorhamnose reductase